MTSFYIIMHIWQLQEAKAKLTQLINAAKTEPQVISRHGVQEMVVLSLEKYEELLGSRSDIVSIFRSSPLADLNLDRDKSSIRDIDL